jgi:hypothetical protein
MPYENDSPLLHICGLWENESKAGDTYFTGNWGGIKVLIFRNRNPIGEKSPTHRLVFQSLPKKEKETKTEDPPRYDTHDPGPDYQEEELPF